MQLIGAGATPLRLTDDGSAHGAPGLGARREVDRVLARADPGASERANSRAVLTIISALGGTERRLLEWDGAPRRIDWSRDGRWLVTSPATIRADSGPRDHVHFSHHR